MRFLRGFVLASIAASAVFTLVLSSIERESNPGNILAGWTVFIPYALIFTAILAPIGWVLLNRMQRTGFRHFGLAGLVLGWLSTMVLFHSPWGLVDPMALAFGAAGLAGGLAFRAGHGPAARKPADGARST